MNQLFASVALLTLAGASLAQTPATKSPESLRTRVNAALDQLAEKAKARGATRADYQHVADEITAAAKAYEAESPAALSTRDRLIARVNELETKAQTAMYDLLEIDIAKDQAIDLELDYALARLKMKALAGKVDASEFESLSKTLTARAEAAKSWNPEIDAITGRLQTAINALMERSKAAGKLTEGDFAMPLDTATEIHISNAYHRLEKRGMEKKAILSDYDDVLDAAKRVPQADADMVKKVQARLDEIKEAVRSGKITREEFQKLKDLLFARARAASSPK